MVDVVARRRATAPKADTPAVTPAVERETSEAKFGNQLNFLMTSSVGVIFVRTSEPYRVQEILRRRTFIKGTKYFIWDAALGWQWYDGNLPTDAAERVTMRDERKIQQDYQVNLVNAILEVGGLLPPAVAQQIASQSAAQGGKGAVTRPAMDEGVFLMQNNHWTLLDGKKVPQTLQALKAYAHSFSRRLANNKMKRLVMTVPPDFQLPIELEADMTVIDLDLPTDGEFLQFLQDTITMDLAESKRPAGEFDPEYWRPLARACSGMTSQEFEKASLRTIRKFIDSFPDNIDMDAMVAEAATIKAEIIKRTEILELMKSENMQDVGGLDMLKGWIAQRKDTFTEEAKAFGIEAPKGITLVGPPGTGKSLCAKAVGHVLNLPVIRFDVGRVFNSLVGASESRMRTCLKMVDALAPCVLFVDEVDKMFSRNAGQGDSGVSKRIMGTFLTWMQETKAEVFVVMTANRVHDLPPEMLRRGRIDEIFSVTLPSTNEIKEIMAIHLRKRGHETDDVNLEEAASEAVGYVPAEIEAAVKEALVMAWHDGSKKVSSDHIKTALANMIPLSKSFGEDFVNMHEWCKNNARPASSLSNDAAEAVVNSYQTNNPAAGGRRAPIGENSSSLDG